MSELLSGTLIYLHGFQSSSNSQKAMACSAFLQESTEFSKVDFIAPNLPFSPQKTLEQVSQEIAQKENVMLMGSSMGGFYASYLSQTLSCPAVLINPVADAHELFSAFVGQTLHNIYTSEKYHFVQKDLDTLSQMTGKELSEPELIYCLLETGDEVLDYRLSEKKYKLCTQKVIKGGDHRFQNFELCLPGMMAFYKSFFGNNS